jgi:hypothetical protein
LPVAFHRTLQKIKGGLAIPALRGKDLKHFAFMINSAPQIVNLAIYPDKNLVQVPAPGLKRPVLDAALSDLGGEHRTETVPPEPHRFVADIDAPFEQKILDLAQ